MKQNIKKDKIIQCSKENKMYNIEESKLNDFYVKFTIQQCLIKEEDALYSIKFNSKDPWFQYYVKNNET